MILLPLAVLLYSVAAFEEIHDGGSCGTTAIPYRIEIGKTGKPDISCATPSCFGDDYTLDVEPSNRQRRYSSPDMTVSCDAFDETVCSEENQWTGGLMEINNGTHRTLKTECCTYRGMLQAENLKTINLEDGETYIGGIYKKGNTVGGFDLIKEVKKVVTSSNRVHYVIHVYRLPCIMDDKASKVVSEFVAHSHISRSKRRLNSLKQPPTDDYEETPRRRHPYAAREAEYDRPMRRRRPAGMRRRPIYRRPVEDYYYYDDDEYETYPRRYGRPRPRTAVTRPAPAQDNRLWPVNYEASRPRAHGEESYNGLPAIYNGVPDNNLPVDSGSSSSNLNDLTPLQAPSVSPASQTSYAENNNYMSQGPLPPPNRQELLSQQVAPPQHIEPSYQQQPPPNTYAQSVNNAYQVAPEPPQMQEPMQPAPQQQYQQQMVYQPAQPAYAPSYPAYNYGGYNGGLNGIFSKMQCFSGDGLVETPSGPKAIKDLRIGDKVLSMDESMITFAPVVMFLHKLDSEDATFKLLTLESGQSIKLTDYHLIYITSCKDNEQLRLVSAKDVEEGDCVHVMSGQRSLVRQRVVNSTDVSDVGIYAPLTSSGDIFVNGVLASCHSNLGLKTLQQTFFSVYRGASSTYRRFFPEVSLNQDLPYGVDYLTTVIDLFLPNSFI